MLKKYLISLAIIPVILALTGITFAAEKYTTTSTINGATINWEYELNDSNQIVKLNCKNSSDLNGKIEIPSTLDGKTVVSLEIEAFKNATSITEVTIPDTLKEISMWAFSGCTNLTKVNLGKVEEIQDSAFKNCTGLTSIKIPKTLVRGASGPIFSGCTNLKNFELEEGITSIPTYLFAQTEISEITIPDSVKKIELWAFSGCNKLTKVNLGKVEEIQDSAFKNCTGLTSIKIPKTVIRGASGPVFSGCTNLKNIEFEEGITIVPSYICASTPITEIEIPNSVNKIEFWSFINCSSLKKITILDNVEEIQGYDSSNSDEIFKNHNDDLTIYCYEGSMADKYAIKHNIKHVYLTKPSSGGETENVPKKNDNTNTDGGKNTNTDKGKNTNIDKNTNVEKTNRVTNGSNGTVINNRTIIKDNTVAKTPLPNTGITKGELFSLFAVLVACIGFYIKYKKYRDIDDK